MNVAVLGAGAWGTAICGCTEYTAFGDVVRHAAPSIALALGASEQNVKYLPSLTLPETLQVTDELNAAIDHSADGLTLIATPTDALALRCSCSSVLLGAMRRWFGYAKVLSNRASSCRIK